MFGGLYGKQFGPRFGKPLLSQRQQAFPNHGNRMRKGLRRPLVEQPGRTRQAPAMHKLKRSKFIDHQERRTAG